MTSTSIDSTLNYRYFGGMAISLPGDSLDKKRFKGYYVAKISPGFWDTLNVKFEKINYRNLDTSYQHSVDDESLEVFIHYNNKIKHIKAQASSLPDSVKTPVLLRDQ